VLWVKNRNHQLHRANSSMHRYRLYVVALLLCLTTGCSTFSETFADRTHADSLVYCGTQVNVAVIGAAGDDSAGILSLFWPFALMDFPLSLTADTLLLPYTLYHDADRKNAAVPNSKPH